MTKCEKISEDHILALISFYLSMIDFYTVILKVVNSSLSDSQDHTSKLGSIILLYLGILT